MAHVKVKQSIIDLVRVERISLFISSTTNHRHLPYADNAFPCLAVLNIDLAIYCVSRLCISGPLQLLLTYLAPSNIGVTKSLGTKSDGPEQFPDAYFLFSPDHMIYLSLSESIKTTILFVKLYVSFGCQLCC